MACADGLLVGCWARATKSKRLAMVFRRMVNRFVFRFVVQILNKRNQSFIESNSGKLSMDCPFETKYPEISINGIASAPTEVELKRLTVSHWWLLHTKLSVSHFGTFRMQKVEWGLRAFPLPK
jgi:hypothetical protein